jgi:aerotaxis receptor
MSSHSEQPALDDNLAYMITRTNKAEIAYANPSFARATGYTIDEIIGSPFIRYLDPATPSIVARDISATVLGGARWEGVLGVRRRDGSCIWMLTSISPWHEHGTLTGSTAIRTRASDEQIASTRRLYYLIEKYPRLCAIKGGKLRFVGFARVLNLFSVNRLDLVVTAAALTPVLLTAGLTWIRSSWGTDNSSPSLLEFGVIIAAVTSTILCMLVRQTVTTPLTRIGDELHLLSSGELQTALREHPGGELAALSHALHMAKQSLVSMIGEVRIGLTSMSSSISELSAGNSNLSRRTEGQAVATAEITASLCNMMDLVSQTMARTRHAEHVANEARQSAEGGQAAIQEVTVSMQEVAHGARQMTGIMTIIEAIAAQTNLLALNAAVEAARAGEHGRGFSVVANEVRVLANRAVDASAQIKDLIGTSLHSMERSKEKVHAAADVITELGTAVASVSALMTEVAASSAHQDSVMNEIHDALANIDDTTQQNAALVEQTSAVTQSLAAQARLLEMTANAFR